MNVLGSESSSILEFGSNAPSPAARRSWFSRCHITVLIITTITVIKPCLYVLWLWYSVVQDTLSGIGRIFGRLPIQYLFSRRWWTVYSFSRYPTKPLGLLTTPAVGLNYIKVALGIPTKTTISNHPGLPSPDHSSGPQYLLEVNNIDPIQTAIVLNATKGHRLKRTHQTHLPIWEINFKACATIILT